MLTFRNTLANNTLTALPEGIELLGDEALDYVTGGACSCGDKCGCGDRGSKADKCNDRECRADKAACYGDVYLGGVAGATIASKAPVPGPLKAAVIAGGAIAGAASAYGKSPNCRKNDR